MLSAQTELAGSLIEASAAREKMTRSTDTPPYDVSNLREFSTTSVGIRAKRKLKYHWRRWSVFIYCGTQRQRDNAAEKLIHGPGSLCVRSPTGPQDQSSPLTVSRTNMQGETRSSRCCCMQVRGDIPKNLFWTRGAASYASSLLPVPAWPATEVQELASHNAVCRLERMGRRSGLSFLEFGDSAWEILPGRKFQRAIGGGGSGSFTRLQPVVDLPSEMSRAVDGGPLSQLRGSILSPRRYRRPIRAMPAVQSA
ncbi:hypothetical protein CTRI78_v000458 [Colletotrichum trifolii]|uniref:Uncharacterized protein n=1 Tax=Colletotrichum trifolii TaxID=5466 RepID=A0A4R8S0J9_COLTR|nr:hypothetical protein CTRI78_v000458 [Colletotrichum trifolii]